MIKHLLCYLCLLRTYIHVFQEAVQEGCNTLPWINAVGSIKDYDNVQLCFTLCNTNCCIRIGTNKGQIHLTTPVTFVISNKCMSFCLGLNWLVWRQLSFITFCIIFYIACVPFTSKALSCNKKFKTGIRRSHNWSIY